MGTNQTPNLHLRYPDGNEAPNVPLWLGYLATDVEAHVGSAYAHVLPALRTSSPIALASTSDLASVQQGFRVAGSIALVTSAAGPAAPWLVALPRPVKINAGGSLGVVGHGVLANGGSLQAFTLAGHTSDPLSAYVLVQGGSFGGYAAAPVAGASLYATFDYETTVALVTTVDGG
jgi:hypothetical protein